MTTWQRSRLVTWLSPRVPLAPTPNTASAQRISAPMCRRARVRTLAAASLLKGMTAHYLIKSVYPVQQGDKVLLHAGAGGVGLNPHPVGDQPGRPGDHHGVDAGEGGTVPPCRRGGSTRLSGGPRRSSAPRSRDLTECGSRCGVRRRRRRHVRGQPGQPGGPRHACSVRRFQRACPAVRPTAAQRRGLGVSDTAQTCRTTPATSDEFAWRAGQLLDAIASGTINVTVSERYRLGDAEQAHRDLKGRKTVGPSCWCPRRQRRQVQRRVDG